MADTTAEELQSTDFGFFRLDVGVAMLVADVFAKGHCDACGPRLAFQAGAAFAACNAFRRVKCLDGLHDPARRNQMAQAIFRDRCRILLNRQD